MATVRSLTADRMLAIEAASVVDGEVVGDNLILTKHDGSTINAGSVRGPMGLPGHSDHGLLGGLADNDHPHYLHKTLGGTVTGDTGFSGTVAVMPPTFPTAAASKQYVDTYTGRTTDWLIMSHLLTNGFTGGAYVRRDGYIVTLMMTLVTRTSAVSVMTGMLLAAPVGFRMSPAAFTAHSYPVNASTGGVIQNLNAYIGLGDETNWVKCYDLPASAYTSETFVYPTQDAWPA